MRHLRWFVCALPLVALSAGCDEALSDLTGPTPGLVPTLSSIQREIFSASDSSGRAACTTCHVPGGAASATGLFLTDTATSYAGLVGRASRLKPGETLVIPGDPDSSYLVRKTRGRAEHQRTAHAAQHRPVPDRRADAGHPPLDCGRRRQ